jgi:hypothetical protein
MRSLVTPPESSIQTNSAKARSREGTREEENQPPMNADERGSEEQEIHPRQNFCGFMAGPGCGHSSPHFFALTIAPSRLVFLRTLPTHFHNSANFVLDFYGDRE